MTIPRPIPKPNSFLFINFILKILTHVNGEKFIFDIHVNHKEPLLVFSNFIQNISLLRFCTLFGGLNKMSVTPPMLMLGGSFLTHTLINNHPIRSHY